MSSSNLVIANWKMNKTWEEATEFVDFFLDKSLDKPTIIAAPSLYLQGLHLRNKNPQISFAAQNLYFEEKGAFTGEISIPMLKSLSIGYVLIGHSERRQIFQESDELIAKKIAACLSHQIIPVFCFGEPLEIREKGQEIDYVLAQIKSGLALTQLNSFKQLVFAYEPIWAIGTGRTASKEQAQEMHLNIFNALTAEYPKLNPEEITILYGGSCNLDNAASLFSQPNINGGLIGGASLIAEQFLGLNQI
ncbi:MAG: triose-phosphate isomerase [Chitinophagales bacterium]|jgi:triosephosphate isomerase|nr:triose-phosphate isomerase [Chitinophagales bacterium]